MLRIRLGLLGLSLLLLAVAACGGGGHQAPSPAADSALQEQSDTSAPGGATSLPGPGDLGQPTHRVSLLGPGWDALPLSAMQRESGFVDNGDGKLSFLPSAGFHFALYGAFGFDGDNGPTSARVSSTHSADKLYIGFSDFEHGRWLWSGPYSLPAGGGTIELSIPNTGNYVSPTAFVSQNYSASYLAVAIADGGKLNGADVELGIHGGQEGPHPPLSLSLRGSAEGVQLNWGNSLSELDPDFAGYVLERAPFVGGEFSRLNADPLPSGTQVYSDPEPTIDDAYRYRIACVDTSGNLSLWVEGSIVVLATAKRNPEVVASGLPVGPLFGPHDIDLDLSASSDPEGEAISEYQVYDGNDPIYVGPSESASFTLQPGCHLLTMRVKAGTRFGSARRYLKIYPVWEDHANFVSSPKLQGVFSRMIHLEGLRDPDSGYIYACGYDGTIPGYAFRRVKPFVGSSLAVANYASAPSFTCKSVMFQGALISLACIDGRLELLRYDGESVERLNSFVPESTFDFTDCALAATDDHIYAFGSESNGALYRLLSFTYPPAPDIDPYDLPEVPQSLAAAWDPVGNTISIAFGGLSQVYWFRYTIGNTFDASASLGGGAAPNLDIEIQPGNHEPAIAYINLGHIYYRWRNSDNSWGGPEEIDALGGLGTNFALSFGASEPRILASFIGGQANVYVRDGADNWDAHSVPFAAATFDCCSISPYMEEGEEYFGCLYTLTDRSSNYLRLSMGGQGTSFIGLAATTGQGRQLCAADAADGLHLVWKDALTGSAHHIAGDNNGLNWVGKPDIPAAANVDLSALKDGSLYLALGDGGGQHLMHWDGAAWDSKQDIGAVPPDYRPALSHVRGNNVHFMGFADGLASMVSVQGNETDGYDTSIQQLLDPPLFTGAVLHSDDDPVNVAGEYLVIGGNSLGYESSDVRVYVGQEDTAEALFGTERANEALYASELFGRNLAGAHYLDAFGHQPSGNVWYVSTGVQAQPLRFAQDQVDNLNSYEYLPVNQLVTEPPDKRWTVAAAEAQSSTAVAFVNSIVGAQAYMEWSDFGRFEQLPLPPADSAYGSERHMEQAQIFVGADGRWHLVYRDYDNDIIYIRSTT